MLDAAELTDEAGISGRLARYLLRPPLSLERMSWNEGDSSVLSRRKPDSRFASTRRAFDPMDFLARLLMHIAQPKLHTENVGVLHRGGSPARWRSGSPLAARRA